MLNQISRVVFQILAVVLSAFVLLEVNYPLLTPQSQLAIFGMLGLVLVFLNYPLHNKLQDKVFSQIVDLLLAAAVVLCFGYVLVQSEPLFKTFWLEGQSLGNRAGLEQPVDYIVGLVGLCLVLEAARRAIGLTLPLLSLIFIFYAAFGSSLPDWLFPHRGYPWQRIVSQTFLHSQGVFGIALKVMFTYVFLFVLFGTLLEKTGSIGYIIDFTRKLFRKSVGGPAKVAVISSGVMGSLSGSAVANTATTGTFTIPMMRSSGFKPAIAGGVEAAASSGGALVPPVMGAGAYMMLEIIEPAVTYLQIIKAAIIPAILYYTSLLLIVHFYAKRVGVQAESVESKNSETQSNFPGVVFLGAFVTLLIFLFIGYTPFRAVSLSLAAILVLSSFKKETRVGLKGVGRAMEKAAKGGISLIAAASSVGIIIGVVTLTGIGSKLPAVILPLAQNNLILALLLLMISTIILGMGLPSAVCYLLVATFVGPILGEMGVVPLSAHLFIFYFGMMSMVTPPVALAAYTAATIAGAGIMQTAFAAFRFALVGFALPYAFVLRPELLLLSPDGGAAGFFSIALNVFVTLLGIVALAGGIVGYWFRPLVFWQRILLIAAALVFFFSQSEGAQIWMQVLCFLVIVVIGFLNLRSKELNTEEHRISLN
ncbi:TRAP transporter fused permease subunit [candidate division KSB1 bacterium]|nr:TRAP transporter fused permease subunit [candidate division KSB1 bacterium]